MMNINLETQSGKGSRNGERGNVLFLILIAVALFAALSYAVTQSSRSGGGDASRETNLVNSAHITQYPASLKTSIVRMIVSNGTSPLVLVFNPPADASAVSNVGNDANAGVFITPTSTQQGGGATYQLAPRNVIGAATLQPGTVTAGQWVFNAQNQVIGIGSSSGTGAPTDETAILGKATLWLTVQLVTAAVNTTTRRRCSTLCGGTKVSVHLC